MIQLEKKDKIFKVVIFLIALLAPLLIIATLVTFLEGAALVLAKEGWGFFYKTNWDPVKQNFGSLVFLVGTFTTTGLALIISLPFSLAIALVTGELYKNHPIANFISSMVEIISAIPSVVIGFWGIFFLAPLLQKVQVFFGYPPYGMGFLTASLILAFMIIPFSASLGKEVITLVPQEIKDGAYALGATRFEVITKIILPYVRSGFLGGFFLSAGRAIGETMAVTMLIGNVNYFAKNLLGPTNTMASIIANEFAEATEEIYLSALMGMGLVLTVSTILVALLGKWITRRFA